MFKLLSVPIHSIINNLELRTVPYIREISSLRFSSPRDGAMKLMHVHLLTRNAIYATNTHAFQPTPCSFPFFSRRAPTRHFSTRTPLRDQEIF